MCIQNAYQKVNQVVGTWFDCAWYSIFRYFDTVDDYLIKVMGFTEEQIKDGRAFYTE